MLVQGNVEEAALCPFLQQMDRTECEVLQRENLEVERITQEWWSTTKKITGLLVVSGTLGAMSIASSFGNKEIGKLVLGVGIIFAAICGSAVIMRNTKDESERVIPEIYDKRVLRLQAKIRALDSKMGLLGGESAVKEQLAKARDFFDLKKTTYLADKK
jgi:hypothetical protein